MSISTSLIPLLTYPLLLESFIKSSKMYFGRGKYTYTYKTCGVKTLVVANILSYTKLVNLAWQMLHSNDSFALQLFPQFSSFT